MSNLGFRHAMRDAGITVLETAVGDRYVLEAMRAGGYALGGEQSGHIVFAEHATTGDGLLTALLLLERLAVTGAPLAELAGVMTRLPQVLINVRADRSVAAAAPVLRRGGRGQLRARGCRAACCCARRARSRWSGSWSRRPPPSGHRPAPSGSRPSSRSIAPLPGSRLALGSRSAA